MTQANTDSELRMMGRALRVLVTAALFGLAASAAAQVTLVNSVQKVEKYVDETGAVQQRLVSAERVIPGDELRYTITFTNEGEAVVDAGSIVITNPIPESTEYLDGTAFGSGTDIVFSADEGASLAAPDLVLDDTRDIAGAQDYTTIRWVFQPSLEPGQQSYVSFNVRLK